MPENATVREPDVLDIVELPESEKGTPCPMYDGEEPTQCGSPSEFMFVYEANSNPDDDRRRNCLCCPDCKPRSVDMATDVDGGGR